MWNYLERALLDNMTTDELVASDADVDDDTLEDG